MFAPPKIELSIPPAITTLQSGRPRFATLVAVLFRLPRTFMPMMNIELPRKRKDEVGARSGQFVAK